MDVGCIILAGGNGLRLGRDKLRETIGGKTLLERVVASARPSCKEIVIVTAVGRDILLNHDQGSIRVAVDVFPDKGPLGGIYTGLLTSEHFRNVVVASDMPFLNEALLRYMIKVSANFDIVVPRLGNLVEPLHALYSKRCKKPIEDMLKEGNLSVNKLLDRVRVRYVDSDEIDRFDPEHLSFFNINTGADIEKARKLAGEAC